MPAGALLRFVVGAGVQQQGEGIHRVEMDLIAAGGLCPAFGRDDDSRLVVESLREGHGHAGRDVSGQRAGEGQLVPGGG